MGAAGAITVDNFSVSDNLSGVVLGDVNQDGVVDFLDIGPFISLLQTGTFLAEGDIDGSGAVDFLDIGPFIGLLSP